MKQEFDSKFYMSTLRTARMVGMAVIPKWKCAWLMAIVEVFGNNEGFTLSPKFQVEREFIQETYHIKGGEAPDDREFNQMLRDYIAKCDAVKDDNDEFFKECAREIKQRYNFKLLC